MEVLVVSFVMLVVSLPNPLASHSQNNQKYNKKQPPRQVWTSSKNKLFQTKLNQLFFYLFLTHLNTVHKDHFFVVIDVIKVR